MFSLKKKVVWLKFGIWNWLKPRCDLSLQSKIYPESPWIQGQLSPGTGLAGSTGTGSYSPPGSTGTGFANGKPGETKKVYGTVTSDTNFGSVDTNYFSSNT